MVNNRQVLNQILQSTPFLSYFKSTLHYGEEQVPERPEHAQLWRGWYIIHVPEPLKVSGQPATSKAGAKENAAMMMAAEVIAYRDVRALNQARYEFTESLPKKIYFQLAQFHQSGRLHL
jgi:hypothetical protein